LSVTKLSIVSGEHTRLSPGLVKPVTRVACGLSSFLRNSLVVGAEGLKKSVSLAGLRNGVTVLVSKELKLRIYMED
jgi:hypothetical protein